eukprot:TRINITY_DN12369_c0_g2_i1.p4 TRINITY_DN12369_c0_g2~~TRINITY_DN12369_c0_g2_i1.p4  ORF type:complete len:136 (-),score=19.80 TRINITY_DN12369_c0_g2_i1:821-1228(-)
MASMIWQQLDGLHAERSLCEERVFHRYVKLKKEANKKMGDMKDSVIKRKQFFGNDNEQIIDRQQQQYSQWEKQWTFGDWKYDNEEQQPHKKVVKELKPDEVQMQMKFGYMVVPSWQKEIIEAVRQRSKQNVPATL